MGRFNVKNVHSVLIMWVASKNKLNFVFSNIQDFNQTTHTEPQEATVFTDDIILYFNCTVSVQDAFKRSHNGTSHWGSLEPHSISKSWKKGEFVI